MSQEIAIKSKVNIQDACNAKMVSAPDNFTSAVVGAIYGRCTGTTTRTSADGTQEFTGLIGEFEVAPSELSRPIVRSGVCFLPDWAQTKITDMIFDEKGERKPGVGVVEFGFEIMLKKAKNPAGYEWILTPVRNPSEADDPLTAMRKELADKRESRNQAMLAAPAAAQAAPVADQAKTAEVAHAGGKGKK